ncbi:MAG: TonB-dependent receptor [Candidatus Kapaibacterium sp.]
MKLILYIVLAILIPISNLNAGGIISGRVMSSEDDIPLRGATVRIEGTSAGAISANDGRFIIKGLSGGDYTVLTSMIGFSTDRERVTIGESDSIYLEITLVTQPLQAGEVVVSANRRVQAVQEVPISVSVIDSRSISQKAVTRLDDIIQYVPGLEINKDNVSIRGSSGFAFGIGSRALMLLDGFPLLAGDNGDIKFDALPMFNIERIEVVKGAGSALYGTSALGGVINIITMEPRDNPTLKARAQYGFYTQPEYEQWEYSGKPHYTRGFEAAYSFSEGKVGGIISGSRYDDQSYRLYDKSERWGLFTKLNFDVFENTTFNLTSNISLDHRDDWVYWHSLDKATRPPDDTDTDISIQTNKYSLFGRARHIFNDRKFLDFNTGFYLTSYATSHDKNLDEYRQSEALSWLTELQYNHRHNDFLLMTYGLSFQNVNVSSRTYGGQNQQIAAVFSQGEIKLINDLTATLGARFDYEQAGGLAAAREFSPKIGLLYETPLNLNFRVSAGHGFRAPSVAERFSTVEFQGFEVIPNPDLEAEKSWSYELGANYVTQFGHSPLHFDIAIFQNDMTDLIEPEIDETSGDIQFRNVTRARIQGVEAGIKTFLFGMMGIETSLTLMDPRDLEKDDILKYRSELLWYNRLLLPIGAFELQADYRYKQKVKNIDERLAIQVDDHDARVTVHVVDLRLIWDLKKSFNYPLKAGFNVSNLLDYYYTEMVGNLGATRHINFQLEAYLP